MIPFISEKELGTVINKSNFKPKGSRWYKVHTISVFSLDNSISNELIDKLFKGVRFLENGCWIRGNDSTIYTTVDGIQSHRLSYQLFTGAKLPYNLNGCHSCDNPGCINPEHIFKGSKSTNIEDARIKGRFKDVRIENKKQRNDRLGIKESPIIGDGIPTSNHPVLNNGW